MQLEKPKLFQTRKGFIVVVLLLVFIIAIRLFFVYDTYQNFISKPFYYTHAEVIIAYEKTKKGRSYTVLKLKSDEGFTFYTTTHRKENFNHKILRLQLFPSSDIGFKDYLGTFYVKSKIKHQEIIAETFKDTLLKKVAIQHDNTSLASFYNAIFFATPLDKVLREKIALLGVSHLVALSGFHLGILWGLVYGVLYFFYRPLQQKFFPFRQALFDVGLLAIFLLGLYVWFVGSPPSLLRSYAMVFVGWGVLLLGMELLSFTFLTSIMLILVTLFPSLLVSLSFWLSVAGVFYIFQLLQYTKHLNKWLISFLVIPLGIFVLMQPVVHVVFGMTSSYQLFSPLLSILFVPFYPLVMCLHLLGIGDVLDGALQWLFSLPVESREKL
ncbi:MAG: ComEC/Rec2 family competence protein, partial [Sulfurovum sp.]|nr:ComEC/Rec2 family competence protein [Sulfurovum sp.]